jgi:hypothetical protein
MITVLKNYSHCKNLRKNFLLGLGVTIIIILFSTINVHKVIAGPCTEVTVNGANGANGPGGAGGLGDTGGTGGDRGTGGTGGYAGQGGAGGDANLGIDGLGIAIVQCNIEIGSSTTP